MLRKLLVYIFIVTSLLTQASTVYACSMMDTISETCCCHDDDDASARIDDSAVATDGCCDEITLVDAQLPGSVDVSKLPGQSLLPDIQPPLIATVLALVLVEPQQATLAAWAESPWRIPSSGTSTYLHTQRLRI